MADGAGNPVETTLGFLGTRAKAIRDVFAKHGVEYMFIGKGAAVAQGFVSTTKDLDIYPSRKPENRERLWAALDESGFPEIQSDHGQDVSTRGAVLGGADFVQLMEPQDDLKVAISALRIGLGLPR
ncbi:hypothetical protein HZA57_08585, partial [Candidatus Poribacteria bacterium]|nr:hypothetical protein [Candidatus Poribacteria bacterium]